MFSQRIGGIKQVKKKLGIPAGDRKQGQGINEDVRNIADQAIGAAEIDAL